MRGSLKSLTLGRLGLIDEILVTHFFRRGGRRVGTSEAFQQELYQRATVAILFPQGTLESTREVNDSESLHVASNILVLGIQDEFWSLDKPNEDGPSNPKMTRLFSTPHWQMNLA